MTSHVIDDSAVRRSSWRHQGGIVMSMIETKATTAAPAAVNAFISGWNAHSPDAVREAFVPEGRIYDPTLPAGVTGAAIAASVQRVLERLGDVTFTVRSVLPAGDDRVAFEWLMRATVATPDGRRVPVTLTGCDVCDVRDGKIVELRGYFDRSAIPEQVSAASAR
jgi:ketosteroid isomerase-like protein